MKKFFERILTLVAFSIVFGAIFNFPRWVNILDPDKTQREEKEKIILKKCKNSGFKYKETYFYGVYSGDWKLYFYDGSSETLDRLFTVAQGNRMLKKCFQNLPAKEAKEKYKYYKFF